MCVCLLDIHYLANTAFSGGLHDDHIADLNHDIYLPRKHLKWETSFGNRSVQQNFATKV